MSLDPKEICRIIKVCSECGVQTFKFEGLDIVFGHTMAANLSMSPEPAKEMAVEEAAVEKDFIEKSELKLKEDQLANLILEDPAEYERLILQGELVDAETEYRQAE